MSLSLPQRTNDPALELLVRKLLRRPRPIKAAVVANAAKRIYAWQPRARTAVLEVQRFLSLANTIETIKQGVDGQEKGTGYIANTLVISLARLYAAHMPVEEECLLQLGEYEKLLQQHPSLQWMYAKVSFLYRAYARRAYAVNLLREQMPTDAEASRQLAEMGVDDPAATIAEIAAALNEQRAYGVKPCLFRDGMLHDSDDAWVFSDGHDLMQDMPEGIEIDPPLAVTVLGAQREIKQLQPERYDHGRGMISTRFDFRDKLVAAIQASGEFTVDPQLGMVPLETYFIQAERRKAYQLFQIIHLLRLYDLIVPQYVAADLTVPAWPVLTDDQPRRGRHLPVPADGLRTLVLPRLRVLRHPDAVRAALDQELAEAERETEQRSQRGPVANHPVTGFVRPLPAGCTASPKAHELAWKERKIILGEGETYVRFHRRGQKPNPAVGHVAQVHNRS